MSVESTRRNLAKYLSQSESDYTSNSYDPYSDKSYGSNDVIVADLIRFIEDQANNAEFHLAELREAQDKVDHDLAVLAEREAAVAEREKQTALSPDVRLKKALKIESDVKKREEQVADAKAKLQVDTADLRQKIRDADALIKSKTDKLDEELDACRAQLEVDHNKRLKQLDADYKARKSALENEENRLKSIRHELSDVEASVAAREHAVSEAESNLHASGALPQAAHKKKLSRALEL